MRTDSGRETSDNTDRPSTDRNDGSDKREREQDLPAKEGDSGKQLDRGTELPSQEPPHKRDKDLSISGGGDGGMRGGKQRTRGPRDAEEAREFQQEDMKDFGR